MHGEIDAILDGFARAQNLKYGKFASCHVVIIVVVVVVVVVIKASNNKYS